MIRAPRDHARSWCDVTPAPTPARRPPGVPRHLFSRNTIPCPLKIFWQSSAVLSPISAITSSRKPALEDVPLPCPCPASLSPRLHPYQRASSTKVLPWHLKITVFYRKTLAIISLHQAWKTKRSLKIVYVTHIPCIYMLYVMYIPGIFGTWFWRRIMISYNFLASLLFCPQPWHWYAALNYT